MDFTRLRATNFLTLGDSGDLFLANRGLNLLQGVNEDDTSASSNGAGKSSVVDALCWALFGVTARGESGDAVINNVAKKNCRVEVVIQDGTIAYSVARHRKHSTGKNSLQLTSADAAGVVVDMTKGTDKETQAEVERIMGCTHEVFAASIYAGQEAMPDLPAMTDKPLKLLIEEAAGVQKLERAYEIARQELLQAEQQYSVQALEITRAEGQLSSVKVELERAKLAHQAHEDGREQRARVYVDAAEASKQQAMAAVQQLRALDEPAIRAQLAQVSADLASIQAVRRTADEFGRTLAAPAREVTIAETTVASLTAEATRLRARFDNAPEELAKPCGACGKPHTADELEQFREHTKQLLVAKVGEVQRASQHLAAVRITLENATKEHERLMGLVPDASQLVAIQQPLSAQVTKIESLKNAATQLVAQAKQQIAAAEAVRTQPNPQQALVESCTSRIAQWEAAVLKARTDAVAGEERVETAKAVAQVFGPAGVRAHILDTVTPFLNERTADYLGTLSDGNISAVWSTLSRNAKGELKEKFAIDVTHAQGGDRFGLISGGEKRKVRLATMMALQDLVASRATKPINLWVGDEIDQALDTPSLERLMSVLERKARERGTVIVISHLPLRDWIDETTIITKRGKQSSVAGALCQP